MTFKENANNIKQPRHVAQNNLKVVCFHRFDFLERGVHISLRQKSMRPVAKS